MKINQIKYTWSYSTAPTGARSGWIVEHLVYLLAQLVVLLRLGLLHPEKEDPVGGLEFQDVDSAGSALRHSFVFTIIWKNDEVLQKDKLCI